MADRDVDTGPLEAREPSTEDLAFLCQKLNEAGARYLILGGFAMRAAGYDRRTMEDYAAAAADVVHHRLGSVDVPFASPSLADEGEQRSRERPRRRSVPQSVDGPR